MFAQIVKILTFLSLSNSFLFNSVAGTSPCNCPQSPTCLPPLTACPTSVNACPCRERLAQGEKTVNHDPIETVKKFFNNKKNFFSKPL